MSFLDQQHDSVAIAMRTAPPAATTFLLANASTVHIVTTVLTVLGGLLTVFYLFLQIRQSIEKAKREQRQEDRDIRRALIQEERDARADMLRERRADQRAIREDHDA